MYVMQTPQNGMSWPPKKGVCSAREQVVVDQPVHGASAIDTNEPGCRVRWQSSLHHVRPNQRRFCRLHRHRTANIEGCHVSSSVAAQLTVSVAISATIPRRRHTVIARTPSGVAEIGLLHHCHQVRDDLTKDRGGWDRVSNRGLVQWGIFRRRQRLTGILQQSSGSLRSRPNKKTRSSTGPGKEFRRWTRKLH